MPKLGWSREWAMLFACAVIPALTLGAFVLGSPLWVVPWTEEFKIPRSTAVIAVVAGNVAATVAAPMVGQALASYSARVILIGGTLVMTAGFLLTAIAPSFWPVAAIYATVIGIGSTFAGILPAQTVALRQFPRMAGAVSGLMMITISLGSALMPLAMGPALERFGWRQLFMVLGVALSVVIAPIAWFCLRDEASARSAPTRAGGTPAEPAPQASGASGSLMGVWAFWLILGGVLPVCLVFAALQPNLAAIATDGGLGINAAGLLISTMGIGSALGGVGVGWLADRLDPRLVYAGVVALLGAAMGGILIEPRLLFVAIGVIGLAAAGMGPLQAVIVLRRFGPRDFPRVQGLLGLFIIPILGAPIAAAAIRDATGSYRLAFILAAVLLAPGVASIWALGRTPPPQPAALESTV